jgi:hypothetical protein
MRSLLTCVGIAGLALAAPAAGQTKPANAAQIVEALEACQAITSPRWIELDALRGLGWDGAQRRSGRSSTVMRGVYEKPDNNAYIIVGKDELREKSCIVNALLASTSDYMPTAQAVSGIIGMPARAEGFTYYWTIGDKQIRLDPAGERSAPTARFAVTAIPQESAE